MLNELFPELLWMIFSFFREDHDIVTLIRLRLTQSEFNQILSKERFSVRDDILSVIRHGHLDILSEIAYDEVFSKESMKTAFHYNQLEIIRWLYERNTEIGTLEYKIAIKNANFPILEYLTTIPIMIVTHNGTVLKFKRSRDLNEVWRKYEFGKVAILSRRLNVLQWAYGKGLTLEPILYSAAEFIEDPKILQWLEENFPQNINSQPDASIRRDSSTFPRSTSD